LLKYKADVELAFYTPAEQGRRVAYLFVASALSGAFGGLIAYGLLRVDIPGKPSWASLYFVEGAITVLYGISLYWLLPDGPQVA
jgi:sugar phosphate permease